MVHKRTVGNVDVWSLGIACMERSIDQIREVFPKIDTKTLSHAVAAESGDAGSTDGTEYTWCFNAALIEIGGKRLLIDTGFGFATGGPGASMNDLLTGTGVSADDIDIVVITHAHGDHIGGLANEGEPSFPSAKLVIAREEYEHWTGEKDRGNQMAARTVGMLDLYASRTNLVEGSDVVSEDGANKVSVIAAQGHTPGHIGLEIASGNERVILLVDTLHAVFQAAHPDWSPRYDLAPERAEATRKALLETAARDDIPVHLYHFPFPGWGRVKSDGSGAFRFVPDGQ